MNTFNELLLVLATPSCWVQNQRYSHKWDKELRQLMARYKFEPVDKFTAMIGGKEVWIENFPYACMRPCKSNRRPSEIRPSRRTILLAYRKYVADVDPY